MSLPKSLPFWGITWKSARPSANLASLAVVILALILNSPIIISLFLKAQHGNENLKKNIISKCLVFKGIEEDKNHYKPLLFFSVLTAHLKPQIFLTR